MTMQIKSIVLYNHDGETRVLDFELGNVNIITGGSGTGKTTLIHIIEYCMGKTGFNVKLSNELLDVIAWYGVLYQLNDTTQAFIAKPPPRSGYHSRTNAFFLVQEHVSLPNLNDLELNSDDDAIAQTLGQYLGISHRIVPGNEDLRSEYELTINQVRFFLFQDEDTIANQSILFHRQSDRGIAETLRETLPYLLGVFPRDYLLLLRERKSKSRELTRLRRELKLLEENYETRISRGTSLLDEAIDVGLLDNIPNLTSDDVLLRTLRSVLQERDTRPALQASGNQLPVLRQELDVLFKEFEQRTDQIALYEQYVQGYNGFEDEVNQHVSRLEPINFFDEHDNTCPVCSSSLDHILPNAQGMREAFQRLQQDIGNVKLRRPELQNEIARLRDEQDSLRVQIQRTERSIQAVASNRRQIAQRSSSERANYIIGRISYYLETTPDSGSDIANLNLRIGQVEQELAELENAINENDYEEILDTLLRHDVGDIMRYIAESLEAEYLGPTWIDITSLTVAVVDTEKRLRKMNRNIGSKSNHLAYHLAALLALHSYFIENQSPVPGILVLDTPSLPYYPEDAPHAATNEDREKLQTIYTILFEFVDKLAPNLQIIVFDHANEDWERFQQSIIDSPWRDGHGLVPESWYM